MAAIVGEPGSPRTKDTSSQGEEPDKRTSSSDVDSRAMAIVVIRDHGPGTRARRAPLQSQGSRSESQFMKVPKPKGETSENHDPWTAGIRTGRGVECGAGRDNHLRFHC